MILRKAWLGITFALGLAPTVVGALPLIFVQAKVTLIADESGALSAIGMDWLYDQEFTHLLAHEIGADEDETMRLSSAEIERLSQLVLDWPPEFNGDLSVFADGREAALLPREDAAMTFEFGHIRETYRRSVVLPDDAGTQIVIKLFDPYYITAYTVLPELEIVGELACPARVIKADMDAAHESVSSLIGGIQVGDLTGEDIYPPFGEVFSDIVLISCEE